MSLVDLGDRSPIANRVLDALSQLSALQRRQLLSRLVMSTSLSNQHQQPAVDLPEDVLRPVQQCVCALSRNSKAPSWALLRGRCAVLVPGLEVSTSSSTPTPASSSAPSSTPSAAVIALSAAAEASLASSGGLSIAAGSASSQQRPPATGATSFLPSSVLSFVLFEDGEDEVLAVTLAHLIPHLPGWSAKALIARLLSHALAPERGCGTPPSVSWVAGCEEVARTTKALLPASAGSAAQPKGSTSLARGPTGASAQPNSNSSSNGFPAYMPPIAPGVALLCVVVSTVKPLLYPVLDAMLDCRRQHAPGLTLAAGAASTAPSNSSSQQQQHLRDTLAASTNSEGALASLAAVLHSIASPLARRRAIGYVIDALTRCEDAPGFIFFLLCVQAQQESFPDSLVSYFATVLSSGDATGRPPTWLVRFMRFAESPQAAAEGTKANLAPWARASQLATLLKGFIDSATLSIFDDPDSTPSSRLNVLRSYVLFYAILGAQPEERTLRKVSRTVLQYLQVSAENLSLSGSGDFAALCRCALCFCLCFARLGGRSGAVGSIFPELVKTVLPLPTVAPFSALLFVLLNAHGAARHVNSRGVGALVSHELRCAGLSLPGQSFDALGSILRETLHVAECLSLIELAAVDASGVHYSIPMFVSLLETGGLGDDFRAVEAVVRGFIGTQLNDFEESNEQGFDSGLAHLLHVHAQSAACSDFWAPLSHKLLKTLALEGRSNSKLLATFYILTFTERAYSKTAEAVSPSAFTYFSLLDLLELDPDLPALLDIAENALDRSCFFTKLFPETISLKLSMELYFSNLLPCLVLPERMLTSLESSERLQGGLLPFAALDELLRLPSLHERDIDLVVQTLLLVSRTGHAAMLSLEQADACAQCFGNMLKWNAESVPHFKFKRDLSLELLSELLEAALNSRPWATAVAITTSLCRVSADAGYIDPDFVNAAQFANDPLELLRVDRVHVLGSSVAMRLLLICVSIFTSTSRRLHYERSLTCGIQDYSSAAVALVLAQDSAIIQQLLEVIALVSDASSLAPLSSQALIGHVSFFLHGLFIEYPLLVKLLLFQGIPSPRTMMPVLVATIPSIHVSVHYLIELLAQPRCSQQLSALALAAALCRRYPIPTTLEVSRGLILALRTRARSKNEASLSVSRQQLIASVTAAESSANNEWKIIEAASARGPAGGDDFSAAFAAKSLASARKRSKPDPLRLRPDSLFIQGLPLTVELCRSFPVLVDECLLLLSDLSTPGWLSATHNLERTVRDAREQLAHIVTELLV